MEKLSIQLKATRDKVADMEARLKAMEISRKRLQQKHLQPFKMRKQDGKDSNPIYNNKIDFEVRVARARNIQGGEEKASAMGKRSKMVWSWSWKN